MLPMVGGKAESSNSTDGKIDSGASNKRVSNTRLRHLGWIPRYPTFAEAMEKSILLALS